jgi:phosphatidylinositol phospholipase C delta
VYSSVSVALNYQTEDKENFINMARFSDNGSCGYVLKPEFMRDESIRYSPCSPSRLDPKRFPALKVELTIVSGQHIPRPDGKLEGEVIDPYVKVRIRGHPDDDEGGR